MGKQRTFRCGTCGKKFPTGKGHNARTCGKTNTKAHPSNSYIPLDELPELPEAGKGNTDDPRPDINAIYHASLKVQKKGKPVSVHNIKGVYVRGGEIELELKDGSWRKLNERERETRTHITLDDKTCWFNKEGELHRDDGSALIYTDGDMAWYRHGKQHRADGPACMYQSGKREWWVDGKKHREGGPAVEWPGDGGEEWWVNGERHRLDGPAVQTRTILEELTWRERFLSKFSSVYSSSRSAKIREVRAWYVNGQETESPELCEKAIRTNLTDDEFYELCNHQDYVVRQIAANNPQCPEEWETLVELKDYSAFVEQNDYVKKKTYRITQEDVIQV